MLRLYKTICVAVLNDAISSRQRAPLFLKDGATCQRLESKMGKVKRSKGSKLELEKTKRQTPLAKQILEDDSVRPTGRTKQRQRNEDDEEVSYALFTLLSTRPP